MKTGRPSPAEEALAIGRETTAPAPEVPVTLGPGPPEFQPSSSNSASQSRFMRAMKGIRYMKFSAEPLQHRASLPQYYRAVEVDDSDYESTSSESDLSDSEEENDDDETEYYQQQNQQSVPVTINYGTPAESVSSIDIERAASESSISHTSSSSLRRRRRKPLRLPGALDK
jgi:hypothetical protein